MKIFDGFVRRCRCEIEQFTRAQGFYLLRQMYNSARKSAHKAHLRRDDDADFHHHFCANIGTNSARLRSPTFAPS